MKTATHAERDDATRVAVILPRHRLWRWHTVLLGHLASRHDVTVFLDDHAPPYAASLRLRLWLERSLFATRPVAWPAQVDPTWRPAAELKACDFARAVNLAEHPLDTAGALEIRYDGVIDSTALIDRLLVRQTPHLSIGRIDAPVALATSYPAIEDKSLLTRGLQFAFARCISLLDRAVGEGHGTAIQQAEARRARSAPPFRFFARMIAEKAANAALRRARRRDHWSVALRIGAGPFSCVADDGERYYADPFLFGWRGRTFLFVEEFAYANGKGVISAAEIVGGRLLAAPVPVLERPYHLSYPFILADGEAICMVPESGANASLDLYRAVEFPWRWELERTLIAGATMADATPLFHQGRWWLFATVAEHGAGGHDQLHLYHADSLRGPWTPHVANPVKSDCRSARPAGRVVQEGARLFRPVQDCEASYGAGLAWCEITALTPTRFEETEVMRLNGRTEFGVDGIHSFDHLGALQVIDIKHAVGRGALRRPLGALNPRGVMTPPEAGHHARPDKCQ